ncbi:MAG: hypothetical protein RLZ21_654 [Pseudomonadota bacterium]|jgi:hypothetical protein
MSVFHSADRELSGGSSWTLRSAAPLQRKRSHVTRDSREYKIIYVFTFPLFVAAALVGRLTGAQGANTNRRSIFGEANELASATIPMAFMG